MSEKTKKTASILLIYTGGTIGMIKDYNSGALKPFDFNQIEEKLPELQRINCDITTVSFENPIDSSNMSIPLYYQLANIIEQHYKAFDGFVVLMGTDTMSYTASAISFMLENLNKPIIFTGSQLPIGDLRTDAKENLITSVAIASSHEEGTPKVQEVGLYFEYKLYRANRTTKIDAEQFEAFVSYNYPPLVESGVHLVFHNKHLLKQSELPGKLVVSKNLIEDVVVLKIFPGISRITVHTILNIPNLKGVVLETYGAGNATTEAWFLEELTLALQRGVYIINVSQCYGGSVVMELYETGSTLNKIGLINGKNMTTESAIAKMMYLLGKNLTKEEFKIYCEAPLRGELD